MQTEEESKICNGTPDVLDIAILKNVTSEHERTRTGNAVADFQDKILDAFEEASRKKEHKVNRYPYGEIPYEIKQIIRANKRLRRLHRRHQTQQDKEDLRTHSQMLKNILREYRENRWYQKIESLDTRDHTAWTMQKKLRRVREHIPPLLHYFHYS
ncbi:hypothetical protein WA026_021324 [Henosepilachna vigintioctopunctata]|uniref:Uncharacterized protein n=1 Tax=Henosepilachna vigintioctopunctata TaxID=420089 RepID=A0AAW1UGB5_9CUCU